MTVAKPPEQNPVLANAPQWYITVIRYGKWAIIGLVAGTLLAGLRNCEEAVKEDQRREEMQRLIDRNLILGTTKTLLDNSKRH